MRVPLRAVIDVRSRGWNRERDRTRGILKRGSIGLEFTCAIKPAQLICTLARASSSVSLTVAKLVERVPALA